MELGGEQELGRGVSRIAAKIQHTGMLLWLVVVSLQLSTLAKPLKPVRLGLGSPGQSRACPQPRIWPLQLGAAACLAQLYPCPPCKSLYIKQTAKATPFQPAAFRQTKPLLCWQPGQCHVRCSSCGVGDSPTLLNFLSQTSVHTI